MSSTLPSARGNGTDENTVSSATSTGPRGKPAYPATSARGLRGMIARFVEPTAKNPDLPRLRVLLAFPALLLIIGVVLVSFSINGSSSGVMRIFVEGGPDSDLVSGSPQAIRSDEWNVQTVWAISQVQQGLPVTNETFPGGMDATVPQDLPRADWSVAFRPYLLGFNFLDVDHAIAWKWWVPGLALVAAAFCFLVTLMPRRPFTAALFSVGFFFSPLFQWWYLGTTLWPVVWGLATMTLIVWATRAKTRVGTWVWAAIVAYLTVVMAMGIYVPFIIPVVLVVAFFAVGSIISTIRAGVNARNGLTYYPADPVPGSVSGTLALAPARTARQTLRGFIPLIVAGTAGSAVTGYWLYTKITTVEAFLGTAYPGERLTPTGSSDEMTFISTIASSFTQALKVGGLLGQNSSEVSTFFLVGMFALPVVVWILVRQARRHAALPWLLISMAAAIVVLIAFMVLPGWDAISHLLLLDRTTPNRAKIGLGLASFVIVPLIISYLDAARMRGSLTVSLLSAALFGGSQVAIAFALLAWEPQTLNAAPFWQLYVVLGTLAVFFLARGYAGLAALAFLVLTGMGSATVNPVYVGVYDLRETDVAKTVISMDATEDYAWVGIGDRLTTAVLLESGVQAYNGFQGAPSQEMWDQIDPDGEYEFEWNRLAGISWTPGQGDPVVTNPYPDAILATFDACDDFAQENVDYVLSDVVDITSDCLVPEKSFEVASGVLTIYEVTAPTAVPAG